MTRTLLYARVSTEDQLEKYGLPLQLRACRELARARKHDVVAEITDDGISGVILNRPGLDRVRQMVRDGLVDVVLMYDADRLSRELAHLLILKPELEKRARLEFVTGNFEDSPSGRMFFGIRGVIAQYEREQTRERTMRGKRERAQSGLIVGGRVLYGYTYDSGRLVPDPERAETVRRIFDWFDAGISIRQITLRLREGGVPTWGGRRWGHSSVGRILKNETFAGVAHYGTHRREGTTLKLRRPDERIALTVPPIISREQWSRVSARLEERSPSVGRPSPACLLRGLLYCSCGRRMCGEWSRKCRSYRCSGRDATRHDGERCRVSVSVRDLDAAAWAGIRKAFSDAGMIRAELRRQQDELRVAAPNADALRAKVDRLKRKEDAAVTALLDPDLAASRATIKAQYRSIQEERRRLEAELATLTRNEPTDGEWLDEAVADIREYIEGLTDPAARQAFMRALVERADFNSGVIRMVLFINSKMGTTSSRTDQFTGLQLIVTARLAA